MWKGMLLRCGFENAVATVVAAYMVDVLGLDALDDFRIHFKEDTNFVIAVINKCRMPAEGHNPPAALTYPEKWAARLMQLWQTLVRTYREHEQIAIRGADNSDVDKVLDTRELDSLKDNFWTRYKVKLPADLTAGDSFISRLKRELDGFVLTIADVLRARSLAFDRIHDAKKLDVGNGLTYTPQDGQSKATLNRSGTADHWLEGLWLVLHGLAVAGTTPVSPAPAEAENRSKNPRTTSRCPGTFCSAIIIELWRPRRRSRRGHVFNG